MTAAMENPAPQSVRLRCRICLFPNSVPKNIHGKHHMEWAEDPFSEIRKGSRVITGLLEFRPKDLRTSKERGCEPCAIILEFLGQSLGREALATEPKLQWHNKAYLTGWPCLKVVGPEANKYFQVFVESGPHDVNVIDGKFHPCMNISEDISGSTDDDVAIGRAATWLADCRAGHEKCTRVQDFVPSRLLSISKDPEKITLVEGEGGRHVEYAALSHRWSEATKSMSLTKSTRSRVLEGGIPFHQLPRMFKDAIQVLRRLDIHYVWIDCMCIVQDDAQDWSTEAALMHSVYSNAAITISAAWCNGSEQSLFNERPVKYAPYKVSSFVIHGSEELPVYIRPMIPHFDNRTRTAATSGWSGVALTQNPEKEWPLVSRAWVYQEQVLSHRNLYFTGTELMWDCQTSVACECRRHPRPEGMDRDTTRHFYKGGWAWEGMVVKLTRRNLTFPGDRLPALAGIAKEFALGQGGTYIFGLWKEPLISSGCATLCWKVSRPAKAVPHRGKTVPSWSWASVQGAIDFEPQPARWDKVVKLLDCQVRHRGDPYTCNDAECARLVISGSVFPATLMHGEELREAQGGSTGGTALRVLDGWLSICMDYTLADDGPHQIASGSEVLCLRYGGQLDYDFPPLLVLRCVDGEKRFYERVGMVYCADTAPQIRRWRSVIKQAGEQIAQDMTITLV